MGGGAGGWGSAAFLGPLGVLLVVGAVIYQLRSASSGPSATSTPETNDAMETLRERYARGEIGDEEFEERARTLQSGSGEHHSSSVFHSPPDNDRAPK
jgi:putative membrane protein